MTKAALLASVLLTACATDGIDAPVPEPTTPIAAEPATVVDGAEIVVATGGALAVRIPDKTSIGLAGNASAGYAVEPYERNLWPNTISPEYWVRANVAGEGSYEIVTSKGIATGLVKSADLAQIALVPAAYELDGTSPFALATSRTQVEVALTDAQARRLVDGTLAIGEDGATQTAWDRAQLAATAGRHTLVIAGDSLAERTLAIDVVDAVDRVESVLRGDRTCFHAYRGDVEVAVAMTFDGAAADPGATNCAMSADPNIAVRL